MPIGNIQVGVVPIKFVEMLPGFYADVLVQNNSANIVYILYGKNQGAADGIIILAATATVISFYRNRANDRRLWIVAAAAGSDVRIDLDYYPKELPGR